MLVCTEVAGVTSQLAVLAKGPEDCVAFENGGLSKINTRYCSPFTWGSCSIKGHHVCSIQMPY